MEGLIGLVCTRFPSGDFAELGRARSQGLQEHAELGLRGPRGFSFGFSGFVRTTKLQALASIYPPLASKSLFPSDYLLWLGASSCISLRCLG
jgi:hypothetical protein